ncbi:hypothetical protein FOZ60_009805 [Perkinsus olseni]|uniref:Rhomboid-like protease n=1 Tax=Perkinsus olseni TaxID=32597 RepID=A0A7J6NGB7_PEROL|nr:hypothetical protein FOZ60_009805 [Perkinsus olseni]
MDRDGRQRCHHSGYHRRGRNFVRGAMQRDGDLEEAAAQHHASSAWQRIKTYIGGHIRPRWSLTLIIIAIQVALYVVASAIMTPRGWIAPSPSVLQRLGASNYKAERCLLLYGLPYLWEIRRFFMPLLLHLSIPHLLFNASFEVSSGARLEDQLGMLRFSILFLGSGLCGNLLSSACRVSGVGASTACYSLIGADLASSWIVWPSLDQDTKARSMQQLKAMAVGLILWEVLLHGSVDHFGHLGGLIGGLLIMPLILTHPNAVLIIPHTIYNSSRRVPVPYQAHDESRVKMARLIGGVTLAAAITACFAAIILSRNAEEPAGVEKYCESLYNR